MVSFVKPSLLGTRKEFTNTFVNPIQNGQCADSTALDVQIMKHRCHVLHKMLEGCVQVSVITNCTITYSCLLILYRLFKCFEKISQLAFGIST